MKQRGENETRKCNQVKHWRMQQAFPRNIKIMAPEKEKERVCYDRIFR